jgi:hypothetical protein
LRDLEVARDDSCEVPGGLLVELAELLPGIGKESFMLDDLNIKILTDRENSHLKSEIGINRLISNWKCIVTNINILQ